jgi:hypothetical protein
VSKLYLFLLFWTIIGGQKWSLVTANTHPHIRALLRQDGDGSLVALPPESRSLLSAILSSDDGAVNDVLTLVEQLDVATSTLHEES